MGYNQVLEIAQQLSPAEQQQLARVLLGKGIALLEDDEAAARPVLSKRQQKLQVVVEAYGAMVHEAWGDDVLAEVDKVRAGLLDRNL